LVVEHVDSPTADEGFVIGANVINLGLSGELPLSDTDLVAYDQGRRAGRVTVGYLDVVDAKNALVQRINVRSKVNFTLRKGVRVSNVYCLPNEECLWHFFSLLFEWVDGVFSVEGVPDAFPVQSMIGS
jgi:hypothetical protein